MFDSHEALFGCNHLGCITMMPVASCTLFPISTPCDDMLAMLVCATRWISMHLYTLAHISWVLPASVSSMLQHNKVMDIQSKPTFVPHRNHHLFAFLLVCLFACLLAFLLLCLPCLSCLSVLCLFASFPSIACQLVSCLCLCMYAHGARMHGAKSRSPKRKQKGWGCEHANWAKQLQPIGLEFIFFPFGYVLY